MKKILSLLFLLSVFSLSLICCSKDEYQLVHSVSFTVDGQIHTEKSTYRIATKGSRKECSKAQYLESEHQFKENVLYDVNELPVDSAVVTSYGSLTEDDIGEFLCISDDNLYRKVTSGKNSDENQTLIPVCYQYEFSGF